MANTDLWPALPLKEWQQTYRTLHRWSQIVGKIRMTLSPYQNHFWHVALYVNARGLTTSPIPYQGRAFEIQFDFLAHVLDIQTAGGDRRVLPLRAESVADFYGRVMDALPGVGVRCDINPKPQEVADPTPFDEDHAPAAYDREYVERFSRILLSTSAVMQEYRSGFVGKCSPVHFFWGSFDLALTRFNGRKAPPRKGTISAPSYSHEEISVGWWPGGGAIDGPAFYSYTVPQPSGIEQEAIRPAAAGWNNDLREFILMYDDVRRSDDPRSAVRSFFQSTYEAGARLANWDRAALEESYGGM